MTVKHETYRDGVLQAELFDVDRNGRFDRQITYDAMGMKTGEGPIDAGPTGGS